ncbi:50S ribosomal protein L15 [Azorhizobium oxalatiphilum]|uniref:Large ribosomal subunit protein uL15 n=1 Tax=Azorhizobium oxalatiphilum TaxID=980631 RepID=A0A917FBJ4_9HYPH|nr:50S ribosomal protein L15 [Azorhizobium oxalatiphilum]GGF63459.1 50S ribosomal protein L15 [Azorhizobium oxalatiphilum]
MKLDEIRDNDGARKKRMRVGRGIGSGKGKTGGRGVKGQKARTGVAIKGFEGGQMPLHRRLPKRGFHNIFALDFNEVTLGRIQTAIDAGKLDASQPVTEAALVAAGVLRRAKDGVRVLGTGELTTKVSLDVAYATKSVTAVIEKLGGTVKVAQKAEAAEAV